MMSFNLCIKNVTSTAAFYLNSMTKIKNTLTQTDAEKKGPLIYNFLAGLL